ncbi:MAG TPA: elongation factor P, partial [Planctomycetota bacterium]|nr:elongation factor P [Planctomycetota bacterium]
MNYRELRKGHVFEHEGEAYVVTENEHITPGNWRGMCQVKMKSVKTGAVIQRRFRPNEKVELIWVDKKEMQYLYQDGGNYVFMDMKTFEQTPLNAEMLGNNAQWLVPNITVNVESYDGRIINVNLPDTIEMEVTETDPVIKGQTATNQYKPAILETGVKVMVP